MNSQVADSHVSSVSSISVAQLREDVAGPRPPLVIDVRRQAPFLESTHMIRGALRRGKPLLGLAHRLVQEDRLELPHHVRLRCAAAPEPEWLGRLVAALAGFAPREEGR